ncbi:MAG: UDP-N-acetylglucosamine 2-epimerase [Gemmatimonadetes bacterium]|nr:UDP-N-acetylglucosamine 2-epimerase [Gemmatimonadota bacterium]
MKVIVVAGTCPFVLSSLHRPSNVDDEARLAGILRALDTLSQELNVVLPLHPRTRSRVVAFGLEPLLARLHVLSPLGYLEMVAATDAAAVAVTDSGGVQEETTVLGVPRVTVREQTERPVTVTHGTNHPVSWPLTTEGVVAAVHEALRRGRRAVGELAGVGRARRGADLGGARTGHALTPMAHPRTSTFAWS